MSKQHSSTTITVIIILIIIVILAQHHHDRQCFYFGGPCPWFPGPYSHVPHLTFEISGPNVPSHTRNRSLHSLNGVFKAVREAINSGVIFPISSAGANEQPEQHDQCQADRRCHFARPHTLSLAGCPYCKDPAESFGLRVPYCKDPTEGFRA